MMDIAFLHTAPVHVATFEALLNSLGAELTRRHLVSESLLTDLQREGETAALRGELEKVLADLLAEARVVLCTCSSLSPLAESYHPRVIRLDRAMAKAAVSYSAARNCRLALLATVNTTLAVSEALILDEAKQLGCTVSVDTYLIPEAWQHFQTGDIATYHQHIQVYVSQHFAHSTTYDALVLAQASMAVALVNLEGQLPKVFSSPKLGLQAALDKLSQATESQTNH